MYDDESMMHSIVLTVQHRLDVEFRRKPILADVNQNAFLLKFTSK